MITHLMFGVHFLEKSFSSPDETFYICSHLRSFKHDLWISFPVIQKFQVYAALDPQS